MTLLPHFQQAIIPIEKLRDYALNSGHPSGKHKAAAFRKALGIERHHAEVLGDLLRATLPGAPAYASKATSYGDYWTTYHKIVGLNARSAIVTAAWIFKKDQARVPQLISCYLESGRQSQLSELFGPTEEEE